MKDPAQTKKGLAMAVRGPRDANERKMLESYLSGHADIEATWFETRDDEDLDAALRAGTYDGCIFADLPSAMDAAVAGIIQFHDIESMGLQIRIATPAAADGSGVSVIAALQIAENAARRRQLDRSRRQVISASVLSFLLLLTVFLWLLLTAT